MKQSFHLQIAPSFLPNQENDMFAVFYIKKSLINNNFKKSPRLDKSALTLKYYNVLKNFKKGGFYH